MRVLIVGGGISGLTAAIELERFGHEVTVFERQDRLRGGGFMIDFFGPGYDVAERLGLLPALEQIHYPVAHLKLVDTFGHVSTDMAYATLRRRLFHDRHFNFMRGELERALFDRLNGRVEVRFGTSPTQLDIAGESVNVKTDRGEGAWFDLVIGADGFRSQVRRLAFLGGDTVVGYLGCHAAAFVTARPIDGLPPGEFVSMSAPGLMAAAYPIRDGGTATFFVHRAEEPLADRSVEACRRELEATYRGRGWLLGDLLDAFPEGKNVYFDDVARLETARWSHGRVVLVGDAAGCVSLIAGQGASLGMFGAFVLAQEIDRSLANVPLALERYEMRVRPYVHKRARAAERNAGWFLPRTRVGSFFRNELTRLAASAPIAWLAGRYLGGGGARLD
jgi:2-polyprenyl-6-methoxyphenol hydroxylase-like FAD-dependent oxidoreductase